MNFNLLIKGCLLSVVVLVVSSARPAFSDEPLKVFILAGQSNMVGHARAHTIATLYQSDKPRDKQLIELVFGQGTP